ncbi:uncharacterized protein LOC142351698 [Convolutriloba macropyga]|uniref:uncharacterized protein LOC142351698 n=1 Tax=Convolutriloba macropyga TaxID=536237 RepID=UPI003F524A40
MAEQTTNVTKFTVTTRNSPRIGESTQENCLLNETNSCGKHGQCLVSIQPWNLSESSNYPTQCLCESGWRNDRDLSDDNCALRTNLTCVNEFCNGRGSCRNTDKVMCNCRIPYVGMKGYYCEDLAHFRDITDGHEFTAREMLKVATVMTPVLIVFFMVLFCLKMREMRQNHVVMMLGEQNLKKFAAGKSLRVSLSVDVSMVELLERMRKFDNEKTAIF